MDYRYFEQSLTGTFLENHRQALLQQIKINMQDRRHGKMSEWMSWLEQLPAQQAKEVGLSLDVIRIGAVTEMDAERRRLLEASLRLFHPWRKGPFSIFGVDIDTEWRSDWKWKRLQPHIATLQDKVVLDVGCGSGYHLLRMMGAGAKMAIGIDPTMLYVMQFYALQHFMPPINAHVLPLRSEELPKELNGFDTVFSMGVLYHCRSPFDHLLELKSRIRRGGELVLETLVVDGGVGQVLVPTGRYAKMRNVWFIPSGLAMESWLQRAGFDNIRKVDETITRVEEQRATPWMRFESLQDFLDPDDSCLTIEGYPAPKRAIFIADVN